MAALISASGLEAMTTPVAGPPVSGRPLTRPADAMPDQLERAHLPPAQRRDGGGDTTGQRARGEPGCHHAPTERDFAEPREGGGNERFDGSQAPTSQQQSQRGPGRPEEETLGDR